MFAGMGLGFLCVVYLCLSCGGASYRFSQNCRARKKVKSKMGCFQLIASM